MRKHIFFDLDGTLIDSASGVVNSITHALDTLGISYKIDDPNQFLGPPLSDSFAKFGLNADEIERGIQIYRQRYERIGMLDENKLYAGIAELLEELVSNRRILYIVTNKPLVYAQKISDHFSISRFFKSIYGADLSDKHIEKADNIRLALKKEGIDKHEAVMIGDRKYDLEAAKQAGIESIGVLFGYGTAEELEKYPCVFLAPTVGGLKNFLLNH